MSRSVCGDVDMIGSGLQHTGYAIQIIVVPISLETSPHMLMLFGHIEKRAG